MSFDVGFVSNKSSLISLLDFLLGEFGDFAPRTLRTGFFSLAHPASFLWNIVLSSLASF